MSSSVRSVSPRVPTHSGLPGRCVRAAACALVAALVLVAAPAIASAAVAAPVATTVSVLDSSGAPLAGVQIAYYGSGGSWQPTQTTGADGAVHPSLTPGSYTFQATWYGGSQQLSFAVDASHTTLTFRTFDVSVPVTDSHGSGITGAVQNVYGSTGSWVGNRTTGATGVLHYELLAGTYHFQATYNGGSQQQTLAVDASHASLTFQTLDVSVPVRRLGRRRASPASCRTSTARPAAGWATDDRRHRRPALRAAGRHVPLPGDVQRRLAAAAADGRCHAHRPDVHDLRRGRAPCSTRRTPASPAACRTSTARPAAGSATARPARSGVAALRAARRLVPLPGHVQRRLAAAGADRRCVAYHADVPHVRRRRLDARLRGGRHRGCGRQLLRLDRQLGREPHDRLDGRPALRAARRATPLPGDVQRRLPAAAAGGRRDAHRRSRSPRPTSPSRCSTRRAPAPRAPSSTSTGRPAAGWGTGRPARPASATTSCSPARTASRRRTTAARSSWR